VRRLGVLGTLVRDTIRLPGSDPVRAWGGIAYSLCAFEALRPPGWSLLPLVKVGEDLSAEADAFLDGLSALAGREGVRSVPEPNNRVELQYDAEGRRTERLTGGVPGWRWEELEPLARGCDALYVNFIAGWELELGATRRLRPACEGPVYCDLHSRLLGTGPDGLRVPRVPSAWREWVGCFDHLQLNRAELELLAGEADLDAPELARRLVSSRDLPLRTIFVTLGRDGAAWYGEADREGRVDAPEVVRSGDPTGCGDVWGIGCFVALLQGAPVGTAVERATRLATRSASLRGTVDLAERLAGTGTESERGAGDG